MFKAGQNSNRLSVQRRKAVWFLLQDLSGLWWVSVADSLEIDSWDLSQAEQCWTTWAVIQGTSRAEWRWGKNCRCGEECICERACVWSFGWRPYPSCHQDCWMVLSTCRLRSKHLGIHQCFRMSKISKKMESFIFFSLFLFFVLLLNFFLLFPAVISFPLLSSVLRQSKYPKISTERNRHSSWCWSEPSERWVDFNIDTYTHAHPIAVQLQCSTDFSSLMKTTCL